MSDIEDVVDSADVEAVTDDASPEVRASRMGWKPKEEYKGTHEWVDAEAFLARADNDPAVLRKSLAAMERNFSRLERGMDAMLEHQQREIEAARVAAYERARTELEERLGRAVEDGDKETAAQILRARDDLSRKRDVSQPPVAGRPDPRLEEWRGRNPWFGSDAVLTDFATRQCNIYAQQGMDEAAQLVEVEKYIRETFPNKFSSRRSTPPVMPGGTHGTARPKAVRPGTPDALTKDARSEHDAFVAMCRNRGRDADTASREFIKGCTPDMFEVR